MSAKWGIKIKKSAVNVFILYKNLIQTTIISNYPRFLDSALSNEVMYSKGPEHKLMIIYPDDGSEIVDRSYSEKFK